MSSQRASVPSNRGEWMHGSRVRGVAALLLAWLATAFPREASAAEPAIFANGDQLIVRVEPHDRLIHSHRQLEARVLVKGPKGDRSLAVSLANRPTPEALIVDLTGFGECTEASLEVRDGTGKVVHAAQAKPVPRVTSKTHPALTDDATAAIERGSTWTAADPKIALPDVNRSRKIVLEQASRTVKAADIIYPVLADIDVPVLSSANAVVLSRQSFAPDDKLRCSLYFSYRKGMFEPGTRTLKAYRKFLVEVPLERDWLAGQGDQSITLPLDRFAIHTSDELEKYGHRWNAPQGYPMLGESSTGLFQGGQSVDVDGLGRIYVSNVADGAGLVRFNPHTGRFEQPPVHFQDECRKMLPGDGDWKRSWDADLAQVLCARNRVYVVFDRNYRVRTSNGNFETCSGVISIPQDNWDNEQAFRDDIRLHAACWPNAKFPLFTDDIDAGATARRTGPPIATQHGLAFGKWRLDLDDEGNTLRLAIVNRLSDTAAADGTSLPPTQPVNVRGLPRQKYINLGSAGRPLIRFDYGEFAIARAALGLALPGATDEELVGPDGRFRTTIPGGPPGTLTIRFDIAAKILAERDRFGSLADSLTGLAQGPTYALAPIPGEPDQVIAACEYGYYVSKLDFSRRKTTGQVDRSYLRGPGDGKSAGPPCAFRLGPYNTSWIEDGDSLWLYTPGYTGLGRMKYSEGGVPLAEVSQELFHTRLLPKALDGRPRDSVKDFLHVEPGLDGQLINIGRGRPGRGGGAYSVALELFDPRQLGPSFTLARLTRCYGLYTPVSRLVLSAADHSLRQEMFVASGAIRPEYVDDIADPAERPQNQDPKIFVYDCERSARSPAPPNAAPTSVARTAQASLADRFGFSLPKLPNGGSAANLAFSPCRQYLVVLQEGGVAHTYSVAERRFVDSLRMVTARPDETPVQPLEFSRPAATILTAPSGRLFFATRLGGKSPDVTFCELTVSIAGELAVRPHLSVVEVGAGRPHELHDVVRCFLPDLTRRDGSCDLILGASPDNGGLPIVRVIDDFVPPDAVATR